MSESELARLADPFPPGDIEWRIQAAGKKTNGDIWAKVVPYVTSRAIMERLDAVVGPEHWQNEFREAPGGKPGVLCGISILVPGSGGLVNGRMAPGEWVTKWDGAELTDVEAVKGGLSGAMKRAAVQWGIGRYLYKLEADFARIHAQGSHVFYGQVKGPNGKEQTSFRWDPPELPAWAMQAQDNQDRPRNEAQPADGQATLADGVQQARMLELLATLHPSKKDRMTELIRKLNEWFQAKGWDPVANLGEVTAEHAQAAIRAMEHQVEAQSKPEPNGVLT